MSLSVIRAISIAAAADAAKTPPTILHLLLLHPSSGKLQVEEAATLTPASSATAAATLPARPTPAKSIELTILGSRARERVSPAWSLEFVLARLIHCHLQQKSDTDSEQAVAIRLTYYFNTCMLLLLTTVSR